MIKKSIVVLLLLVIAGCGGQTYKVKVPKYCPTVTTNTVGYKCKVTPRPVKTIAPVLTTTPDVIVITPGPYHKAPTPTPNSGE